MIAEPPSDDGAVHVSVTWLSPGVAARLVGVPGTVVTVTWTTDDSPVFPARSVALDWNVWAPCDKPVAEYVQDAAVPLVAWNAPPSTEIWVVERLVSDEVPESGTVVEVENELSAGLDIVDVGLVVSIVIFTTFDVSEITPVESVAFALIVCKPSADRDIWPDHIPDESAVVVPTRVVPSYKLIITLGLVDVPDIVCSGLLLSKLEDGFVITGLGSPWTITFTVADAVAPWLSDMTYENESEPKKFRDGVYVMVWPALITAEPWCGVVTLITDIVSPTSGS